MDDNNSNYLNKKRSRSPSEEERDINKTNDEITNYMKYSLCFDEYDLVYCNECRRNITKSIKFICEKLILCIDCFISDKHPHDYNISDKLSFSLFNSDWSAKEEMMLLNGIEKFGFDNWTDIADFIQTKDRFQCESHYYTYYRLLFNKELSEISLNEFHSEDLKKKEKEMYELLQNNPGELPLDNNQNKEFTSNQSRSLKQAKPSDSIGYFPKRYEFENEYLNEAELDIAEIEFLEDESDNETDVKLKVLRVYNSHLAERERRKKFVIEKEMVEIDNYLLYERKLSKEEREIFNCLKPLAKATESKNEFLDLFEGIIREKTLMERINLLTDLKNEGIRTQSDIEKALETDYKREKRKFNSNFMYDNLGLSGKIAKFLKEHTVVYTDDEIKLKEKELISKLNTYKIGYKDFKDKIIKKAQNNIWKKSSYNDIDKSNEIEGNNRNVNIIDYSIDLEKIDSN